MKCSVSGSKVLRSKVHNKGCRKNKDTRPEVPKDHKVKEATNIPYSEPSKENTAIKKFSR